MDHTVQVAIVTAAASIVVAVVSFMLSKHAQRQDAIQGRKLAHYRKLLSAISDLVIKEGRDIEEANERFAHTVNTIALVAPQQVITALMNFHDEIKYSNPNRTEEAHDRKLKILLLEMRKSMSLPFKDDPETFNFHLVGSKPPKGAAHRH